MNEQKLVELTSSKVHNHLIDKYKDVYLSLNLKLKDITVIIQHKIKK